MFCISESCYRYWQKRDVENDVLNTQGKGWVMMACIKNVSYMDGCWTNKMALLGSTYRQVFLALHLLANAHEDACSIAAEREPLWRKAVKHNALGAQQTHQQVAQGVMDNGDELERHM